MKYREFNDLTMEKLKDKEFLIAYLETAFEEYEKDGELKYFLLALQNVAKAKGGMTKLSRETGINREYLYKVFKGQVVPNFNVLVKIMRYCGISFKFASNF